MRRDRVHAVKCAFCERPAFAPQYIKPAMCKKHHELVLMASRLQRQGVAVTQEAIEGLYTRRLGRRLVAPGEVAGLLRDVLETKLP